jgi:hypothetical protein
MKCYEDNRCLSNPLRYDPAKHARNTLRRPVQYSEHGECPYRKNGLCHCVGLQVARIRILREQVKKYRVYLETVKGWKIVKENISFTDENFIRSIGGEVTSFNNPKLGRTDWYVRLSGWKSGTLQDYLNGFVSRDLEYIGDISINYSDLLKRFDMIKITDKKIELFGELENFNDDSVFNWDTDEDVEFNTWFSKEFKVNGKRVIVNIREVK